MQFFTDSNMQFQLIELTLNQGETVLSNLAVWSTIHLICDSQHQIKYKWLWCRTLCKSSWTVNGFG